MLIGLGNMLKKHIADKKNFVCFPIRRISQDETCPFERQYTAFCKVSFNGQGNTSLFLHNSFRRCTVSSQHRQ